MFSSNAIDQEIETDVHCAIIFGVGVSAVAAKNTIFQACHWMLKYIKTGSALIQISASNRATENNGFKKSEQRVCTPNP
jgi:hypothetical protein